MTDTPNQNNQIPSTLEAILSRLSDRIINAINVEPLSRYRDMSQALNKLTGLMGHLVGRDDLGKNLQLSSYNTWNAAKDLVQQVDNYGFKPINLYIEQSGRIERLVQLWEGMTKEQRDAISGFTSSLQTLVGSTFSIKTAFQLSDRMSDIKQLANIQGENSRDIVLLRNIYRRKGTNDDDFMELQKKLSALTTSLKLDPQKLAQDKNYQFFAQYNAELMKTADASGKRYGALDRQHQLEAAIKQAQANKIDPDIIKAHLEGVVGEKIAVKVYAVITDPNAAEIEKQELVNADRQEKGMPASQAIRDKKAQTQNQHEAVSGGVSVPFVQPIISNVMGLMGAGLDKYPEEIGKIQGGAALLSEGSKYLEFAYKAYKGLGAVKGAFYPSSSDGPDFPHRTFRRGPKSPVIVSPPDDPDPAPATEGAGSLAWDGAKAGAAASVAMKKPEHASSFVDRLQQKNTALTRGGAVIKSTVNAKKHGFDYIPSSVKDVASKVKNAAKNAEKKLQDPSVQRKLLQDLETIIIIIFKRFAPALRNVPTDLLLPGRKQIIAQDNNRMNKRNYAFNQQPSNFNPILGGPNPEIPGMVVKADYRPGMPGFGAPGTNRGALMTRNSAMDMQHAGQAYKLSQEINNQQYHTVINVTPANADPMRVAEIVYNKVKQASFGQSKSVPSAHATQMTMV